MLAEDCAGSVESLGIASAPVAGISIGGAISQQPRLRHPDRVTRLVLISTSAGFYAYATMAYKNMKKLRQTADPDGFALEDGVYTKEMLVNGLGARG